MFISRTNSTNTLLREWVTKGEWPAEERFLRAGYQTAGRGQTGNGWESEADKNLLFSVLLPPDQELFYQNVAISVALHRGVIEGISREYREYIERLAIKWPNDLYYEDRKLAGILVENAIVGNEIKYSIAGIGLNVNQTEWQSDAPNPVSLKQITGKDYDLDQLMNQFMASLDQVLSEPREDVWNYYKSHLYRKEGFWPFVEREVNITPTMNAGKETKDQFQARIKDVLPTGEIILIDEHNNEHQYHFKQIRYII